MNDLDSRIKKLERSQGRHRCYIIVVSLMLVVTVVFGAGLSIALTGGLVFYRSLELRTRRIQIVDADGHLAVEIGSLEGGDSGMIKTLNASGETMVLISTTSNNRFGMITTSDDKGQKLVSIAANHNGAGSVTLLSSEGHDLVTLGQTKDRMGAVVVYDPADNAKQGLLTPLPVE